MNLLTIKDKDITSLCAFQEGIYLSTCEFDGHTFNFGADAAVIPCVRLAYDARRGDAISIALLNAYKVEIMTADGGTYWPMEAAPDAVVETR